MKHVEWWRIERLKSQGQWMRTIWNDKRHADTASAKMLSSDPTIYCIHRSLTKPSES